MDTESRVAKLTAHNTAGGSEVQTVQAETAAEAVTYGEEWGEGEITRTVIGYAYDALSRLTEANYDNGQYFHYGYDANGNLTGDGMRTYAYDRPAGYSVYRSSP